MPLGIANEPAPGGLVGIQSHDIGNSTLAQLAGGASEYVSQIYNARANIQQLQKLLDRLPLP